jgi:hypothetical protein
MFWSHVFWLDPVLFDAYNPKIKADGRLIFLNECVGPAAFAAVAGVQLVLVALLIRNLGVEADSP